MVTPKNSLKRDLQRLNELGFIGSMRQSELMGKQTMRGSRNDCPLIKWLVNKVTKSEFRRFGALAVATTALTDGTVPGANSLAITTVTASVAQYGKKLIAVLKLFLNNMENLSLNRYGNQRQASA